ncbi:hypothetical protein [Anaeromicropila herbilytica]|uniref:Uncharacterized protein n=1 Tax=Anaeromicropila herbilytica TaxID=2785025 RepID=A0A7R7EHG9_9FIRM|nr:hypothetical protein [Anaeromicropila herbilytica]BCN28842.1 hypothetical protein bsdtb5_01370 [Anaeromicropila herbilytica]
MKKQVKKVILSALTLGLLAIPTLTLSNTASIAPNSTTHPIELHYPLPDIEITN